MNKENCWENAKVLYEADQINEAIEICKAPVCSTVLECQRFLGWAAFSNGEPDLDEAIKWFLLASEQQDAYSFHCLGIAYYEKKLYEESVKYLTNAVNAKMCGACYRLGCMYQYGMGVSISNEIALKYFKLGAEHGYYVSEKAGLDLAYMKGSLFNKMTLYPRKVWLAIRVFFVALKDINDEKLSDIPEQLKIV